MSRILDNTSAPGLPEPDLPASASAADCADSRLKRKADRRKAIIEAAAKLFARHGYSDCDMECVAAKLGIAKGTLYLYFEGKQQLFFACVDWGMAEMQRLIFEAADEAKAPLQRISDSFRAYLQFFSDHPEYVELMIQERAVFHNARKPTYFEHRNRIRPYFRTIYESLVDDGLIRGDVPIDQLMETIGATLYGTMFFNHAVGRTTSLDDQHQRLMKTVFGGMLTDVGRAKYASLVER